MPNNTIQKWPKPYTIRLDGSIQIAPEALGMLGWQPGDKLTMVIDLDRRTALLSKDNISDPGNSDDLK